MLYPSLAAPCCLTAQPHARGFLTRHLCASCACVSSGGACQAGNRGERTHNCKATHSSPTSTGAVVYPARVNLPLPSWLWPTHGDPRVLTYAPPVLCPPFATVPGQDCAVRPPVPVNQPGQDVLHPLQRVPQVRQGKGGGQRAVPAVCKVLPQHLPHRVGGQVERAAREWELGWTLLAANPVRQRPRA